MTQITVLPIGSSAPHDWWRRVSTAVNLLLGEVSDLIDRPTRVIDSDYAATANDYALIADATNGPINITLPTPTKGTELLAKKIDSSANAVTLTGQIDGDTSRALSNQWDGIRLYGNGDRWLVL